MSQRQAVRRELDGLVTETRARVRLVAQVTGVLWAIELLDLLVLGQRLDAFGVAPRTLHGLAGIFAAPFLHGGIAHIAANTVPLIALGILATARKRMDFWVVAFTSTVTRPRWDAAPTPGSTEDAAADAEQAAKLVAVGPFGGVHPLRFLARAEQHVVGESELHLRRGRGARGERRGAGRGTRVGGGGGRGIFAPV